jgi:hypothetical protein
MDRVRTGLVVLLLAAWPLPALSQLGYGSPGVVNVGAPEAALFPDLAALQDRLEQAGWLVRGQATFILQGHPAFRSPYRGARSLRPAANARNTLSTDLILGRRLWAGAEFVLDLSVTRGFGLSNSTGVAAFPTTRRSASAARSRPSSSPGPSCARPSPSRARRCRATTIRRAFPGRCRASGSR